MKKILVPTDLTSIAELGLQLAVELAKRAKASISLVNFTQHPFGKTFTATGDINMKVDSEDNAYALQLLKVNRGKLENLVAKYQQPHVVMTISIVDDEFKNGMDDYLHAEGIDLVVMGTSGEENAKEAFTGNHTEQAIKVSACPVISVRDGFNVKNLSNIVVAVAMLTDNQVAKGLNAIRDIAECFQSTIHLVHVREDASEETKLQEDYFSQMAKIAGLQNYAVKIIDSGDRAEGIRLYAKSVNAGLIAVIKNRKDGIFRIFSNHLSDQLIKDEGRPVFTVNLHNS